MAQSETFLEEVAGILKELDSLGFQPILVGGMALVTLGSRRVTKDFDFLVAKPEDSLKDLVKIFYQRGMELASKLDKNGDIIATIDNSRVAALRLKMDAPNSAYFLNFKTGLRIDLLFDFPLPAHELAKTAQKTKIGSHLFHIASEADLIRLKKIAHANRSNAADLQDLEFLQGLSSP